MAWTRSVSMLICAVLVAPPLAGAAAVRGSAGGGTISCSSDLPAYGQLNVSQPMAAGTSGTLVLGGDNNKFIGSCGLSGTIPAGWTVTELSGAALSASPGAGNAGTFTWNSDDSVFADGGSFLNSGTFSDESTGFSQQLEVSDFVNTGTVSSASSDFGIGGTTARFENRGVVEVSAGDSFAVAGTFVLERGGTIRARGVFDLAGSTFEIDGGAVSAGVLTSPYHLGVGATSVDFGANLPASSRGTIELDVAASLSGVVPKGWTLELASGLTAARGARNDGTLEWLAGASDATFSDPGTFVNAGVLADDASGFSQQISVATFVNEGTVLSRASAFGLSAATTFVDRGVLSDSPKGSFGAAGTFVLEPGATVRVGGGFTIGGSTFEVRGGSVADGALSDPYHLGVGATTVVFSARIPTNSRGSVEVEVPTTVEGGVPVGWKLALKGGTVIHKA